MRTVVLRLALLKELELSGQNVVVYIYLCEESIFIQERWRHIISV